MVGRRAVPGVVFVALLSSTAARAAEPAPPKQGQSAETPPSNPGQSAPAPATQIIWDVDIQGEGDPFVWRARFEGPTPSAESELEVAVNVCAVGDAKDSTIAGQKLAGQAVASTACTGKLTRLTVAPPGLFKAKMGYRYMLSVSGKNVELLAVAPVDGSSDAFLCTSKRSRDALKTELGKTGDKDIVVGPDGQLLRGISGDIVESDDLKVVLFAARPYRVLVDGCGGSAFSATFGSPQDTTSKFWKRQDASLGRCEGTRTVTVTVEVPDQGGVCSEGQRSFTFRTKRLWTLSINVGMAVSLAKRPLGERYDTGLGPAFDNAAPYTYQNQRTRPVTPVALIGGFICGRPKDAGGWNMLAAVGIPLDQPLTGALIALGWSPVMGVNVLLGLEVAHQETTLVSAAHSVALTTTGAPPTQTNWAWGDTAFLAATIDQNLFRWLY
jgi:hypothetical protein